MIEHAPPAEYVPGALNASRGPRAALGMGGLTYGLLEGGAEGFGAPRVMAALTLAVRNGDDLLIRSWRGRSAAWFRGAQTQHQGHIQAGAINRDVLFVDAAQELKDQIDAAYHSKYTPVAPSYVEPMVNPEARATTLKLEPRS